MMENQNNPEKQYGGSMDFFPPLRKRRKHRRKGGKKAWRGRRAISLSPAEAMIVVYLLMTSCMLSFVL